MIKRILMALLVVVLIATVCFFTYDIVTSYKIEQTTDDISRGYWGFVLRVCLAIPIVFSEVDIIYCTFYFLLSEKKHLEKTILNAVVCVICVGIIATGTMLYFAHIYFEKAFSVLIGLYFIMRTLYLILSTHYKSKT